MRLLSGSLGVRLWGVPARQYEHLFYLHPVNSWEYTSIESLRLATESDRQPIT